VSSTKNQLVEFQDTPSTYKGLVPSTFFQMLFCNTM